MLLFTENKRRSAGLSATSNPRTVLSSVGLVEASQAEAEAGTIANRYMSPRRVQQSIVSFGRTKLTQHTTYNVPADFASVGAALTYLQTSVDGGGYTVTIQIADGTYSVSSTIQPMVGIPVLYIKGDTTTPTDVVLTPASSFIFEIQVPLSTLVYVQGVTLTYTGCPFGAVRVFQTGNLDLQYCAWVGGGSGNTMVQCTFGNLIFEHTHSITDTGSNNVIYGVGDNGFLTIEPSVTTTFVGTPTVAGVFQAYRGGCINGTSSVWVGGGSVSGFKALLTSGGIVDLIGATGTIPGSAISDDGSGVFKNPDASIEFGGGVLAIDAASVTSAVFTATTLNGPVMTSSAVLASGNAAETPTMGTNSPVAGPPVKWLYINDNGTFRWFPTW